jgi:hypothetical protein
MAISQNESLAKGLAAGSRCPLASGCAFQLRGYLTVFPGSPGPVLGVIFSVLVRLAGPEPGSSCWLAPPGGIASSSGLCLALLPSSPVAVASSLSVRRGLCSAFALGLGALAFFCRSRASAPAPIIPGRMRLARNLSQAFGSACTFSRFVVGGSPPQGLGSQRFGSFGSLRTLAVIPPPFFETSALTFPRLSVLLNKLPTTFGASCSPFLCFSS